MENGDDVDTQLTKRGGSGSSIMGGLLAAARLCVRRRVVVVAGVAVKRGKRTEEE